MGHLTNTCKNEEIPSVSPHNMEGAEGGGIAYFDKQAVRKRGLTWNGSHLPYNSRNVDNARILRKTMTPAEKKLWYGFLRTFKFRVLRQRPIDHYIADFYCAKLLLVIELDGPYHQKTIEYDNHRAAILKLYGLRIFRFTNDQVISDFTNVCKKIEAIPPISPLNKGGAKGGGIQGSTEGGSIAC